MIITLILLAIDTIPVNREAIRDVLIGNGTDGLSETATYYHITKPKSELIYIDLAVVILLTVEWILRFLSCPKKCIFLTRFENPVAFLSLLPSLAILLMYVIIPTMDQPPEGLIESIKIIEKYVLPLRVLRVSQDML